MTLKGMGANSRSGVARATGLAYLLPAVVSICAGVVNAQTISLQPDQRLQMLDCWPSSYGACFRMYLNVENVVLPSNEELARSLTARIADQEMSAFYASTGEAQTTGRTALILVDVSGSMNEALSPTLSRFRAAKAAVKEFLGNIVMRLWFSRY